MKKEKQQGITLIALIITIIVILILVAVTVRTVANSGLFDHAKNATSRWAEAQEKEANLEIGKYIDNYLKEETTEEGDGSKIYAALYNDETNVTLTFNNTTNFNKEKLVKIYVDETGNPIDINEITPTWSNGFDDEGQYIFATNLPWFEEGDYNIITCVDVKTKVMPNNTSCWFAMLSKLVKIDNIKNLDTHNVSDMNNMFYNCNSLTNLDVSNFNTSNVTNMNAMFYNCNSLDLTNSNVINFETYKVTSMSFMFCGCKALTNLDVSNFNTSSVTDMCYMFKGCSGLTDLDVSSFNTNNVTNMTYMFYGCSGLTNLDVSKFNTSNVTNMNHMFYGCSGLTNLDVSKFNTNNVTDMCAMFMACTSLTDLDIANFDTSKVTDMSYMFCNNTRNLTNLDLSNFNTSKVTNMKSMFANCRSLTNIYVGSGWLTSQADTTDMFSSCGTSSVTTK